MYSKKVCLILFSVFFVCGIFAQDNKDFGILTLDGQWEIVFDDKNEGIEGQWYLNKNYDTLTGKKEIKVPSCWEEYEKDYEGVAFYREKFYLPESWNNKIIEIKFNASNYKTEVWINDQVVGFHEGGYSSFKFRIDEMLKPGEENVLMVRVVGPIILTDKRIDRLGRQEVPMWRGAITGGIWQSVELKSSGSIQIDNVFIEPRIESETAHFNVSLKNFETYNQNAQLVLRIISASANEIAAKKEMVTILPGNNQINWEMIIPEMKYWSPENPYLYKASIELNSENNLSDRWETKFGMREFTIENERFYLNGKPIYLKAAFFEGLYPVKLAYPDSREMAIREIMLAKEAGFNMIRPWRKPPPPMWLDLCDSIGMMTVGSLAVECMNRPVSTPYLPHMVENELIQSILRDRNRTCVVQWELFNEINRPVLIQMLNSMSVLARELDATRLILDESGGWGVGANMYLPYQKSPIKFNDIHHYSGSQITQKEYNSYLAISRNDQQIREMGLGKVDKIGRNVIPGIISYVSELGYGSTPELMLNNQLFKEKGNPIVAPAIYHMKMADEVVIALQKTGFDKIYPDINKLFLEQQKMHGIANKRMIEAARSNPLIAGYCVHALVGGDWVIGAGLLDLWRNPKTLAYEMTKQANQARIVSIRILPRNVYAEKGAKLEVTGINELDKEQVKVSVKIKSEKGKTVLSRSFSKDFASGISSVFEEQLNTRNWKGNYEVEVKIVGLSGKTITENTAEFHVFTSAQLKKPVTKLKVVDPAGSIIPFLKTNNIEFMPFDSSADENTLILVGKALLQNNDYKELVKHVKEVVKKGGYAIFLEVPGQKFPDFNGGIQEVETEELPFAAKLLSQWTAVSGWAARSHIVKDHPVFKGLPVNQIMHGVYENVHPKTSMAKQKGNYIAGLIGYDHYPNQDIMLRHYNGPGETWWAANVLETQLGKGKMLLSTLDIINNLGSDPVAEKILYNMINYANDLIKMNDE